MLYRKGEKMKYRGKSGFFLPASALLLLLTVCGCGNGGGEKFDENPEDQYYKISAGDRYTTMIKTDGTLWACGSNSVDQLGDGTRTDRYTPVKIMDSVASVSAGVNHTMAIKTDGSLWAWGWNYYGQFGDGTTTTISRAIPVKIMDSVAFVSAGSRHTMAIKTDGSLWAWGNNDRGQLGDGTITDRYTPVKIMDSIASVSAGVDHTVAIKTDSSLWAWGNNDRGQLGDGTRTDRYTPVKIMDSAASVSAGGWHTMEIKTDGSLWAWGYNIYGQLGDGTSTDRYTPVKIMDSAASVSAGSTHTVSIKTDGSLWAWGNEKGAFVGGTRTDQYTPVKKMDSAASVSAGGRHTVAIKTDGSLWAWGSNDVGQLGDGTTIDRNIPKIMEPVYSSGTGFFISGDGIIVTCAHVVENGTKIAVKTNNIEYAARILAKSQDTDLAILKINYRNPYHFKIANFDTANLGDKVSLLGFPLSALLGADIRFTDGILSAKSGIKSDQSYFQISAPVQPGNSGGPIFNHKFEVIGVAAARLDDIATLFVSGSIPQNINFGVKSGHINPLLGGNKPGRGNVKTMDDAIKATVQILVAK